MNKPKLVTVRKLSGLTPQLTELMVEQVGMDRIRTAARGDKANGVYDLIRSELPSGVTDSEVREVGNALSEMARERDSIPFGVPDPGYSIYLTE